MFLNCACDGGIKILTEKKTVITRKQKIRRTVYIIYMEKEIKQFPINSYKQEFATVKFITIQDNVMIWHALKKILI